MKIVLFEDEFVADLYPLVYLRPAFDLRCGIFTLKEKIEQKFPDITLYMETRDELDAVTAEKYGQDVVNSYNAVDADDDILLVNASAVLGGEADDYTGSDAVALSEDGRVIWAYLQKETVAELDTPAAIGLVEKVGGEEELHTDPGPEDILIRYPWNLVHHNLEQIEQDYSGSYEPARHSKPLEGAAMIGPKENLYIGKGVEIQPHVWIDCREGPVIIEDGVTIRAHTSIEGPAFIGRDAQLFEAKIREGTSIGPVCRVGGEIEESIIHSHSNKYHTGFLGHSYVCQWVNLGALTTNSDLKNDYSSVKLRLRGKQIDSGDLKVGSFIGDHTKTSIGTLLNTGSVVGVMCNLVAGSSVLPKYIPSFCWYVQDRISKGLGMNYALRTARAAMDRRDVELTDAMVELMGHTEDITSEEKLKLVKKYRRKIRG